MWDAGELRERRAEGLHETKKKTDGAGLCKQYCSTATELNKSTEPTRGKETRHDTQAWGVNTHAKKSSGPEGLCEVDAVQDAVPQRGR